MGDYFNYVQQYREASALFPEDGNVFWPRLQTRGLLLELALKTYICAVGEVVEGHDLVVLAQKAVERGLQLQPSDWEDRIVKVNDIYFKKRNYAPKYLSRYPTPNRGLGVWVTPGHAALDEMIARIVEQARTARAKW
jgi:hypothetical protein